MPGVYASVAAPPSLAQSHWSAVLWSRGVLSHQSAAVYWQLPANVDRRAHVTVPDRRYRQWPPSIRLHRVPLSAAECTTIDGLPLTNRMRTVIDLLRTSPYPLARDLLDRALQQRWATERDVRRSISRQLGRTGNAQLRRLLAELEPAAQAESERRLHRLLRGAGVEGWRAQYPVCIGGRTYYLDAALPQHRLAIEVDGRRFHDDSADRFESDRDRQNALIGAGWRVLRFTWAMLVNEPERVIAQIVQMTRA